MSKTLNNTMQSTKGTKVRSENWLAEDKQLLLELVRERVRIIENKNTDTNTNKQKKTCWDDLLDSFNEFSSGKARTVAQLKTQWGTLKLAAKKEKATERRELIKTGGGPFPPMTPSVGDISAWLPNEFVIDQNVFDSDTININKIVEKETSEARDDVSSHPLPRIETTKNEEISSNVEFVPVINIDLDLPAETEKKQKGADQGIKRKLPVHPHGTNKTRRTKTTTRDDAAFKEMQAISSTQVACRTSLHAIQMEVEQLKKANEKKIGEVLEVKARAIEFKAKAMQAKYEYYQKKNAKLDSRDNK